MCGQCGNTMDADINAARNISMDLAPIYYRSKKRQQLDIKSGFWWKVIGEEIVVPLVQEA